MKKTSRILATTAVALLLPAALFSTPSRGTQGPGTAGLAKRAVERIDLGPEQGQHIRASHEAKLTGELARIKESHVRAAIHADVFHETAIGVAGRSVRPSACPTVCSPIQ